MKSILAKNNAQQIQADSQTKTKQFLRLSFSDHSFICIEILLSTMKKWCLQISSYPEDLSLYSFSITIEKEKISSLLLQWQGQFPDSYG